jgi:hypothetical protein
MSDELRVDVSALSDSDLRALSTGYARLWHEQTSAPWMLTWLHAVCVGIAEVLDDREATWQELRDQLDGGEGHLVEPGTDRVAEALEELHGEARDDE